MASNGANLSLIASYARQGLKYGLVFVVLFMIGRSVLEFSVNLYHSLNPAPPSPPTMAFGLLPSLQFPTQLENERPKSFVLDTVGQTLPDYGNKLAVYFMPTAQPNLLALDRAKEQAAALEFVLSPEKMSDELYRWRRDLPFPAILEVNIVHGTFDLRADWASSVDLLSRKEIPNPTQLTGEMRSLLRNANILSTDIATATPQISYVRAIGGELRPASSISEADFVQLDLFRQTPVGIPTVTAARGQGVVRILFSGSRQKGERVLQLKSQYYPVLWTTFETYPPQPVALAWQALQSGGGFVTSPIAGETATIRKVYLAYFEPTTPQNYFQPVYVFEGDDNFQAVVPALDPRVFIQAQ